MKIPDLAAKRAHLDGDKVALVDIAADREITYAQLDDRATRAAHVLHQDWGVQPGDRIAVLAHNRTELFELLFACAKLGAVLVPLNWRLPASELVPILQDAEPVGIVHDDALAAVADDLQQQIAHLRLCQIDDAPVDPTAPATTTRTGTTHYESALRAAPDTPLVHPPRDENDLWYLLYTSGTTGRPKGVMQTYGMALANCLNIGLPVELSSSDTFLSVLPYFHTGGINLHALPTLIVGGTTLVPRSFDAGQCLALLAQRTAVFFGVPSMYQMLADHEGFNDADLSRVRSWGSGGAAMPVGLLQTFADRGIRVRQGMGMTETGPTLFLIDESNALEKAGSVGKPQLLAETRIVDANGQEVPDGTAGELRIRGPGITPGYWRMPDATAEAFDDEGWLRSGDVARRDEDGYYYIVDRLKDMYISGGENVYPAEVEQVLLTHPAIDDAAVVGVPDGRWGEVGKAFIVASADVDPDGLRTFCRERIAAYKVPKHVAVVPELPRNAAGKLLKHELATFDGEDA